MRWDRASFSLFNFSVKAMSSKHAQPSPSVPQPHRLALPLGGTQTPGLGVVQTQFRVPVSLRAGSRGQMPYRGARAGPTCWHSGPRALAVAKQGTLKVCSIVIGTKHPLDVLRCHDL